jgi:hypothetical protein
MDGSRPSMGGSHPSQDTARTTHVRDRQHPRRWESLNNQLASHTGVSLENQSGPSCHISKPVCKLHRCQLELAATLPPPQARMTCHCRHHQTHLCILPLHLHIQNPRTTFPDDVPSPSFKAPKRRTLQVLKSSPYLVPLHPFALHLPSHKVKMA